MRSYLLIIILLGLGSCSKELDEKTIDVRLDDPIVIDSEYLSFRILNSDLNGISNATVELITSNQILTEHTDATGLFTMIIPNNIQEGYILMYAENQSKSIIKFEKGKLYSPEVILGNNTETGNSQLFFDDIFEFTGTIVDASGNPVPNFKYTAIGVLDSFSPAQRISYGTFFTGADGRFSIIGDNYSRKPKLIISGSQTNDQCNSLIYDQFEVLTQFEDSGNLIYFKQETADLNVEVKASGCFNDLYSKVYIINQMPLGINNGPLGPIQAPVCTSCGAQELYVGIENSTGENFDGGFYTQTTLPSINNFNPCTPNGYFFEMIVDGELSNLQVVFDKQLQKFKVNNSALDISSIWGEATPICSNNDSNETSFTHANFDSFTFSNSTDSSKNLNYDQNEVMLDLVVDQDDYFAGIMMSLNETKPQLKIRFRIAKI